MSYRYPFPPFADGWFQVAYSGDIAPGQALPLSYFGKELVVFRDGEGHAKVLDAYCPHLGAHFGHGGTIVEGQLRCPFHGFRFDGDGSCKFVPGEGKVPPALQAKAWATREVDGAIMVWYDHEGSPPPNDPPDYFELRGKDGWTEMQWHTWSELRAHPQETSENSVDLAHFSEVHGYTDVAIVDPIDIEGETLRIGYKMTRKLDSVGMPGQSAESVFRVRVHGLGHSVVEVTTPKFNTEFRTYVLCTPIDEDHVVLRGGGTMKALPDPNVTAMIEKVFFKGFVDDVEQDFDIWQNKRYLDRPVLTSIDGPIGAYRKWCRQFYGSSEH